MTNITADEGFRRFGIATVCISVPTYWLLILISWREKITPLKIAITNKCRTLLGKKAKVGVVRRSYKSKDRKHLKATQKNAINASLQRRLTSMSSTQGGRGSIGQADQELDELGAKNRSVSPAPIPRRATVQFEETLQRPSRHETAIIAEPSPNTSDVDVAESMRRANRATSMPEGTDRNGTAPRRSSLLRRFSSSSGVEAPPVCPV